MSKKSFVLLSVLGVAAAAAGAYVVLRGANADDLDGAASGGKAAEIPGDRRAPAATGWSAADDDTLSEPAAVVDDEPANVR